MFLLLVFLERCHKKPWFDKTGQEIQSNWKSVRTQAEIDADKNRMALDADRDRTNLDSLAYLLEDRDPLELQIESNWSEIKRKYRDYWVESLEEEEREEALDHVKELFMENLNEQIKRWSNDPKGTETAVHVTNTEPQGQCKKWKDERMILQTASTVRDFLGSNPRAVCKRKFKAKDLSKNKAIKHGNDNEPIAIQDFEETKGVKVTRTGLHISKQYPNLGKSYSYTIFQTRGLTRG